MGQTRSDKPPEDTEQKQQLFFSGWKVSELLSSLANIKNEQRKYRLILEQTHISLFCVVQSAVKSNSWDTAVCENQSLFSDESISSSCSQIDVVKENAESPRTEQRIPGRCVSEDFKQLSKSKSKISVAGGHKKSYICPPLHKLILPYVFLIKNCLPMPISLIQHKCFNGEILCKMQHFRKERKTQPSFETSSISKVHASEDATWAASVQTCLHGSASILHPQEGAVMSETPYVFFHNLRGLQWKLYKSIVKRKEPLQTVWREANYRTFKILKGKPKKTDYILPLIFKDSIIVSVYPAYHVLRREFKWE
nr:PREDICTED: uncharacterized protein LOC104140714 [Struthio camelus australis]